MRKALATLSVVALIVCGASLLTSCEKAGSNGDDDSSSGESTTAPEDD